VFDTDAAAAREELAALDVYLPSAAESAVDREPSTPDRNSPPST